MAGPDLAALMDSEPDHRNPIQPKIWKSRKSDAVYIWPSHKARARAATRRSTTWSRKIDLFEKLAAMWRQNDPQDADADLVPAQRRRRYEDDRQGDLFNQQLDLFTASRPVASQAGAGSEVARRAAAEALRVLRGGATLLGRALSSGLAARQRVSLVGQVGGTAFSPARVCAASAARRCSAERRWGVRRRVGAGRAGVAGRLSGWVVWKQHWASVMPCDGLARRAHHASVYQRVIQRMISKPLKQVGNSHVRIAPELGHDQLLGPGHGQLTKRPNARLGRPQVTATSPLDRYLPAHHEDAPSRYAGSCRQRRRCAAPFDHDKPTLVLRCHAHELSQQCGLARQGRRGLRSESGRLCHESAPPADFRWSPCSSASPSSAQSKGPAAISRQ